MSALFKKNQPLRSASEQGSGIFRMPDTEARIGIIKGHLKEWRIGAAVSEIGLVINYAPEKREELFGLIVDRYLDAARNSIKHGDFVSPIDSLDKAEQYAVTVGLKERVKTTKGHLEDATKLLLPDAALTLLNRIKIITKSKPPNESEPPEIEDFNLN